MASPSFQKVKSAGRVLEIIEFLNQGRTSATVSEISTALQYPQSSTSVLLRCLHQLGYLYQDRFDRTYRLTARTALLGCWAENGNFRGGRTIDLVDAIGDRTSQTVVLSLSQTDYAVHHLHVRKGTCANAASVSTDVVVNMLGNVQGELQLSSYPEENIRLALHRLNAEQPDKHRRVRIADKLWEFRLMSERGWAIGPHAGGEGLSAVAAMVPRVKRGDRIVVSIVARHETIEEHGARFLRVILEERDRHFMPEAVLDSVPADIRDQDAYSSHHGKGEPASTALGT